MRRSADELPDRAQVPLATIIRDWERTRQTPALEEMLRELGLARQRVPQNYVGLVDEYRQLIAGYLEMREKIRLVFPSAQPTTPTLKGLLRETLKQLDALDARRQALRPEFTPMPPSTETQAVSSATQ